MRKHILILGHDDAPQFVDIYNQYTRLFDADQYEVTVAYLTGKPNADTQAKTLAQHCLFLDMPKSSIRSLKLNAIRRLLSLTREKRFVFVICHRYKPTYIMMWVSRFCHIPNMISVTHELGTMRSIKRQLTIAALAPKTMLFAGVSNAVRDDMRKSLWCVAKERIHTLYNMVDVDLTEPQQFSRSQARAALKLNEETFVFGNLGRLVKNKDQRTLINAFAIIKSACPNAKLMIIGQGALEVELKTQVINFGLQDDVIFTGFINNGFRYMKAFDCFVLSSKQEAFGRVLLEAMIARVPIIATRVHGIPEVVGDTGLLVHAGDLTQLAAEMQKMYEMTSQQQADLADRAYQRMLEKFSIPVFKEQFSRVLEIT